MTFYKAKAKPRRSTPEQQTRRCLTTRCRRRGSCLRALPTVPVRVPGFPFGICVLLCSGVAPHRLLMCLLTRPLLSPSRRFTASCRALAGRRAFVPGTNHQRPLPSTLSPNHRTSCHGGGGLARHRHCQPAPPVRRHLFHPRLATASHRGHHPHPPALAASRDASPFRSATLPRVAGTTSPSRAAVMPTLGAGGKQADAARRHPVGQRQ